MCYGMGCRYEDSRGECQKPWSLPCPENEEAVSAYEDMMEEKAERELGERRNEEK